MVGLKVSACAPANIQRTTFNHVSGASSPRAALFQQLESIPAPDNHDLSIFTR